MSAPPLETLHARKPADIGAMAMDVVYVGDGWGGLNGATEAHKRGLKAAVIDAGDRGRRSASRNNAGLAVPDMPHAIDGYARERIAALMKDNAISVEEAEKETLPLMRDYMGLTLEACAAFFRFMDAHGVANVHKGPLFLQRTPYPDKRIALEAARLEERYGLGPLRVLKRFEVRDLLHASGKPAYAGGWEYTMGGYFDPPPVYDAVLKSLEDQGVPVFHHCKATGIADGGDGYKLLYTSQGPIRTRFVVMASAYKKEINPEACTRIMFYAPHAYVATLRAVTAGAKGVWGFEDSGTPAFYANSTGSKLYYGATDTIADTPWDNAHALRKTNAMALKIWSDWRDVFHEIAGHEHKTARLNTTTSGFPDIAEEGEGRIITSGGFDDRGIVLSAYAAAIITGHIAAQIDPAQTDPALEKRYAMLLGLPRGKALTEAEKAAYLKVHLPNVPRIKTRHRKIGAPSV